MFAEGLVNKIGGLRPVELWTPDTGRTPYLEELAAKEETKGKVRSMAWEIVQERYKVKVTNLSSAMPKVL